MGEPQVLGRGALIGSTISAGFGIGWVEWGASGLGGAAAIAIRIIGVVIGVVLIAWCVALSRRQQAGPDPAGRPMFSSRAYWLVVLAEIVALVAGGLILNVTHQAEYQITWYAFVVGVHFLGFGKLFVARFYVIGAALIVVALAGLIVGLAGGGIGPVASVTGFGSALALFVAPLMTIVQYRTQPVD